MCFGCDSLVFVLLFLWYFCVLVVLVFCLGVFVVFSGEIVNLFFLEIVGLLCVCWFCLFWFSWLVKIVVWDCLEWFCRWFVGDGCVVMGWLLEWLVCGLVLIGLVWLYGWFGCVVYICVVWLVRLELIYVVVLIFLVVGIVCLVFGFVVF